MPEVLDPLGVQDLAEDELPLAPEQLDSTRQRLGLEQ